MSETVTSLLQRLVAIPSVYPPGDTRTICREIAGLLEASGYQVHLACREEGIENVVARIGNPIEGPCVMFNSHIDTVAPGPAEAWETPPFTLSEKDSDRLAGLGAANCKGSAATHLWLAQRLAERGGPLRGEVVFTFVGDEESLGPNGTQYLAESGMVRPDLLILGAPTANQLVVRERGVMWTRLSVVGKGAHAGAPEAGDNAILRLLRLLNHLQQRLVPRLAQRRFGALCSTMSIGTIEGGDNTNVVPAHASATIDRRLLPATESVQDAFTEIMRVLEQSGEPPESYRLELLTGTDGFSAPDDGQLIRAFQAGALQALGREPALVEAIGASDGRHFSAAGIEIVNFGPGEGAQGHAPNESLSRMELEDACAVLEVVLERLSGFRLPGTGGS